MNQRHDAWLAWCLCAVSLVLTVLGLLLLITSRSRMGAPVYDYWLVNTVIAIGFSTVGAVITPRLPRQNPVGWLFCTIGLVGGVRLFVAEYAIVTLLAEPGSLPSMLPGGETLAWVSSWVWVLHVGLFVFLALLFPDGRSPSSRWRPLVWGIGVVVVAGTVSVALWPETARGFDPINYPLRTEVATDVINPVETLVYALGLIAAASLLVRLRGSQGVERQQVKWFTYAVAVLATSATLAYVVSESMGIVWLGRGQFRLGNSRCRGLAGCGGHSDLALPTLQHRPHHKPYPRLRFAHRGARGPLLRQHRRAPVALPRCDRRGIPARGGGLHPGDSRPVQPFEAPHPGLYRPQLLP